MNDFQFISSLISTLAWPVAVVVLVLVFRIQLGHLLGRIRSYKGMGQELTFGDRLADAENSVDEAVRSAQVKEGGSAPIETEASPLAREAEANPSCVVIRAWEDVASAIVDLSVAWMPDRDWRRNLFSPSLPGELLRAGLLNDEFVKAARELFELRNSVAHGKNNPTPGEAVAYAESAQVLAATARIMADFIVRNRQEL